MSLLTSLTYVSIVATSRLSVSTQLTLTPHFVLELPASEYHVLRACMLCVVYIVSYSGPRRLIYPPNIMHDLNLIDSRKHCMFLYFQKLHQVLEKFVINVPF